MIFYLNRGLILEQKFVKALKKYYDSMGIADLYKNYSVNITNEHPFARLLLQQASGSALNTEGLFPAIIVTTEVDTKPSKLIELTECQSISLDVSDFDLLIGAGYMVSAQVVENLKKAISGRDFLYGICNTVRRSDRISIEIWADNIQLKNELYEMTRLFVATGMRAAMDDLYQANGLTVFDESIKGQRSNNYNLDFGVKLSGAQISFDGDYFIEQSIIDTEIVEISNDIITEVTNHVKGID
jgi:hypothetical protein